jgi:hypothetical protein
MSAKRAQFTAVHRVADRVEPRLARAMRAAVERIRSRVPLESLADAIADGHQHRAAALVEQIDIEDALQPSALIVRDAFARGEKLAGID